MIKFVLVLIFSLFSCKVAKIKRVYRPKKISFFDKFSLLRLRGDSNFVIKGMDQTKYNIYKANLRDVSVKSKSLVSSDEDREFFLIYEKTYVAVTIRVRLTGLFTT